MTWDSTCCAKCSMELGDVSSSGNRLTLTSMGEGDDWHILSRCACSFPSDAACTPMQIRYTNCEGSSNSFWWLLASCSRALRPNPAVPLVKMTSFSLDESLRRDDRQQGPICAYISPMLDQYPCTVHSNKRSAELKESNIFPQHSVLLQLWHAKCS